MITCQDLTFRYNKKASPILENYNLTINAGTLTTLSGASGSGKSTLLYLLALMIKPSSGKIIINGQNYSNVTDAERTQMRATTMGYIFQDALLDPARTVIDNVCESALISGQTYQEAKARALELLETFGVQHRLDHKPGQISGGQAQRVALCRALVTNPKIIFADEPTGNLDHETSQLVWQALKTKTSTGTTVIVATHDETLAHDGDQQITLQTPTQTTPEATTSTEGEGK